MYLRVYGSVFFAKCPWRYTFNLTFGSKALSKATQMIDDSCLCGSYLSNAAYHQAILEWHN